MLFCLYEITFFAPGGFVSSDTMTLRLGSVPILFVDDDGGTIADPHVRDALNAEGYHYRHWDTAEQGSPAAATLERYPAVIWATGVVGDIDDAEQAALRCYTDGGGALLATGQDIGWFLNDYGGPADQAFYHEVFHNRIITLEVALQSKLERPLRCPSSGK